MYPKSIDAIGQFLQIVGVLLSVPGLWIEYWGILLERRAARAVVDEWRTMMTPCPLCGAYDCRCAPRPKCEPVLTDKLTNGEGSKMAKKTPTKKVNKKQLAIDTIELCKELVAMAGLMEDRKIAEKVYKAARQLQRLNQLNEFSSRPRRR
jgi:hypothetical protein